MTATFLIRNPVTGDIEKARFKHDGFAPEKAFNYYNAAFLKLAESGYFAPADPMDAYQTGIIAIENAAEKICRGEIELGNASPATYIANAGKLALLNFHQRQVQPMRRDYRDIEERTRGTDSVGLDGFDIDNFDATTMEPDGEEMSALELGEILPGIPDGETRIRIARQLLESIFERLNEEIVRAFRGYIKADGNFVAAAKSAGIGKTRFYRLWPRWISAARKIGEKIAVSRH